ncbi:MAG TPA: sulfatase [Verrucomicrobiae bacterium]|nr:sulfatase [Verrucomicrobiae bacterium]
MKTGFFAKAMGLVAALIVGGWLAAPAAEASARPNIIFILVDDLRWDALSCMGHPVAKTPNIDRLAKEGALFKNFFVSIPLCSPSRSSFLTGQYAHATGVIDNSDHSALSHQLVTFPKLLHDAGYETAYVGKWHMGADDSPRPGFDRWVSFKGQGVYENPNINVDGKASKVDGYMTDILNGHALDFVKQEHKKPFALYLAHKAVHGPFTPAERHKDLYAEAKLPLTPNHQDKLEGKPALTRELPETKSADGAPKKKRAAKKAAKANGAPTGHENTMRQQLRALAAIDEGVGQLLKALEDSKQLDNSMVIFTSDNGYFWGEHGLGDKRWAYEESIRDPLLMRYPKLIKAGTTLEPFALNIDIAPTLLDVAGAPIPKAIQGRSLLPLFKDAQAPWRKSFLTEYFAERAFPRTPTWQAVRTDRWKYIRYTNLAGMDELYDLKADPYEMNNLIKDVSAQSALREMKAELAKLRQETGAQ